MILVVGATGYLGGMITRMLLDQGRAVRILVRQDSEYHALVAQGAQPIVGDLKDPTSLVPACVGINTVITTANSAQRGGDDNPQTVDLQGNAHLIDAAQAAAVRQFIFISASGADSTSPVPFLQAKGMSEQRLRASGMGYTIFAPTPFMDVWLPMVVGTPLKHGQPVTLIGAGRRRHSFIAVHDVAAFAVAAIEHAGAINQHFEIGGPEAVSWQDIVAITGRILKSSVHVQTVAMGQPVPGLYDMASGLMTHLETYDAVIDMEDIARTFGVHQVTVEAFLRQMFRDMGMAAE